MKNKKNNREIVFKLITENPLKYSRKDILEKINWNLGALNSCIIEKKIAHLVKASKRVRGKNKYPTGHSFFYRAYDKKKLYEYYKLYNQNQGD